MDTDPKLRVSFDTVTIFIDLSPEPNLFALQTVIANFRIIQVQVLLENDLLSVIYQLYYNVLVRIFDIKNDCLVPNGLNSLSHISLREGLILIKLHHVLAAFL